LGQLVSAPEVQKRRKKMNAVKIDGENNMQKNRNPKTNLMVFAIGILLLCAIPCYGQESTAASQDPATQEPVAESQLDFSAEIVVSDDFAGAHHLYAADLNDDGYPDILATSGVENKFVWHLNDKRGGFERTVVVADLDSGTGSVAEAADLDNDGDLDVVTASNRVNQVAWYANDGSGNYELKQIITTNVTNVFDIEIADLNGDDNLDVVLAVHDSDRILLFPNQGEGVFGDEVYVSFANGARSVRAADLDDDGFVDLISAAYYENLIAWHRNVGNTLKFDLRRTISQQANGVYDIDVADLDGDGDLDVVSASFNDDKIAWYENRIPTDAKGSDPIEFGPQQVITDAADGAVAVITVDLDEDGDADLVSASRNDNRIALYVNSGDGVFDPRLSAEIPAAIDYPTAIAKADFDRDGDLDLVSASYNDNKIAWYKNGRIQLADSDADGIFDDSDNCPAAANVDQTDLDGDGIGDICDADADGDLITADEGDCNDFDATIYPGAVDDPYDDVDQDCSDYNANDLDGDGIDAVAAGGTDCNDDDASVYPGAAEVPYDGIDQDCSGSDLTDVDGDGYAAAGFGGKDCNDADALLNPGAAEVCGDGIDNNCDGLIDEGCVVAKPGDFTGDGSIGYDDFYVIYFSLNKCVGQTGFVAEADFDQDGCVTFTDYRIWYGYYINR
jgi:hypothetical protein